MATTRIRTLNLLPEVFRTEINSQFLSATLDVLASEPKTTKIEGYIGDTLGYGVDSRSSYVLESSKVRNNYQLDPGVVFLRPESEVATDFINYPGMLDALTLEGGVADDHSRLFNSQFYSWDSFVDLDKLNNFHQYYWLPNGPNAVDVNSSTVFVASEYVVTDEPNGYLIKSDIQPVGVMNPTITLLRGGTYTFAVNQASQFWIQGEPGITGFSQTQPNVSTRDILGVDRNGITSGFLTFTVPTVDAQQEYAFPGNHLVDLVSTIPFRQLNGAKLNTLSGGIDGVTSLDGRTVMFYHTGIPYEKGFVRSTSILSSTPPADVNVPLVTPKNVAVSQTFGGTNQLKCDSTADLIIGNAVTFSGTTFGGIQAAQTIYYVNSIVDERNFTLSLTTSTPITYNVTATAYTGNRITLAEASTLVAGERVHFTGATYANITEGVYYVKNVVNPTTITISTTPSGPEFDVTDWYGEMSLVTDTHKDVAPSDVTLWSYTGASPMLGLVNGSLYEEGRYTDVNSTFYTIQYLTDPDNPNDSPTIRLVDTGYIPMKEKITAKYGTQWVNRDFYRNELDVILLMPYFSAIKDVLYYQDGTTSGKVGQIRLINSNASNVLNVETDILGHLTYTSPNKVTLTNGLKVTFSGDVVPASYLNTEYYVEGVGTSIELIPVTDLVAPEVFTSATYVPFDSTGNPYDTTNYDTMLYVPTSADYLTIARNAKNKNAWSRSNRWFHADVIAASATYNNDPSILTNLATQTNKAKRPILEFYPNLKLFNSGTIGKKAVDFMDTRTTDALALVAGQTRYCPDVETYTGYSATIVAVTGDITGTIDTTNGTLATLHTSSTAGFHKNDRVNFFGTVFGGVQASVLFPVNFVTYYVRDILPDGHTFTISATKDGEAFQLTTGSGSMDFTLVPYSTWVSMPAGSVHGSITVGHYVEDSTLALPFNAYVSEVSTTSGVTTMLVSWDNQATCPSATNASLVFGAFTLDNFGLFDGARIVFAGDTTPGTPEKIFVANLSRLSPGATPTITLTEATDSPVIDGNQLLVLRGFTNTTHSFYLDTTWKQAQQKSLVNQPPLFDIYDASGISLGNPDFYQGTSFHGTKLFGYGVGSGSIDSVLGVPLKYSSVDNIGDISFEVFLNSDKFTWVEGSITNTAQINTGYVYSYSTTVDYTRHLGWQTTVDKSTQYQVFEFQYTASNPTQTFLCDIALQDSSAWAPIKVFVNNVIQSDTTYSYTVTDASTLVTFSVPDPTTDTVVQILILSPQMSSTAYYSLPINLTNNPFNADLVTVNMGDFRRHYDSIFNSAPGATGNTFGSNNIRDLGNLVAYGDSIIQNSASLALPGTFLRKQNFNLPDALAFNSREYVNFKNLLINTANNIEYSVYQTPAYMLDAAMDQITTVKTEDKAFFWSDMLPAKAPYISNTYTIANVIETTIYSLSKVYDFSKANYSGILVYLTRQNKTTQLIKGVDYSVSATEAKLTVTRPLTAGDVIEVKEFNQTYGSFVPNTPTKLGMYPATQPKVVQDSHYMKPAWFIVGHDGSHSKLYGTYNPETDHLVDFRDQVLLEFEKRVFNNLKSDAELPIRESEIVPGFFRNTGYDTTTFTQVYQLAFLTWVGQNKVSYKNQVFSLLDEFTYNYGGSTNKVDRATMAQGYWRGVYQYFYDTSTPDVTPWEMLHFRDKPTWWDTRYGPAPYTADNEVLWGDLERGISWNNGTPVVIADAVRPGLSAIIPVDSSGKLLSPYRTVIKDYYSAGWQRDWKVGDMGPTEFSYRRSSSWPFDLMRMMALLKPAEFYNLGVDLDNYRYNQEFDQYLFKNRNHLKISDVEIYGSGTPKTSYLNWVVDYQKQFGVDATTEIQTLLRNLDVRLVYRLAGFSDKNLLEFYVEKSTVNSKNSSLLIPDDSYSIILYDNQPTDRITYSGVTIQLTDSGGYLVTGASQTRPYFNTCLQKQNRFYQQVKVEDVVVKMYDEFYDDKIVVVPYGTIFYSLQEVSQFLMNYGHHLEVQGMKFEIIDNGVKIDWALMVKEFLYWAQTGWSAGSLIALNPVAKLLTIDRENNVVQPLTLRQQNFILNQNQAVIQIGDLAINRTGTAFSAQPLKDGDTLSYGAFNTSSIEHGVVFSNRTIFNDVIYNLTTGLRQSRLIVKGTKSAEWNGTLDAQGFIMNQDNVPQWSPNTVYVAGSIVSYRNRYWTTTTRLQASPIFDTTKWMETPYDQIQKGLLPNPSTRAHESTLYYNTNQANLENDGDLLGFSLIGYRPREYLSSADLSDVTQVNVYKNMIKNKGTLGAINMFKDAKLKQGTIDYDLYENWAIKTGDFGGVMASNFVEIKLNQDVLTHNPSTIELTNGEVTPGITQEVPMYALYNYGRAINTPYILPTLSNQVSKLPEAGYVNFDDVKVSSYFYSGLSTAVDQNGQPVGVNQLNVGDYVWVANHLNTWQVFTPQSIGTVVQATNNMTGVFTITFGQPHGLTADQPFAILNFDQRINGYYLVKTVLDQSRVTVTLTMAQGNSVITGLGVAVRFTSVRVATPADIQSLPHLPYDFTNNKVWVDTDADNSWAVFEKSINYLYQHEFTKTGSTSFGDAVAYSDASGHVIVDAGTGDIYRYKLNSTTGGYDLMPDGLSIGGSPKALMVHAKNIFVMSESTFGQVSVFSMSVTNQVDSLTALQTFGIGEGVIPRGDALTISGDTKWIYHADLVSGQIHAWRYSDITGLYEHSFVLSASALGLPLNYKFGYSLSTDYYGKTLVVGAPDAPSDGNVPVAGYGKTYIYHRIEQSIEVSTTATAPQTYSLAWTPTSIHTTITQTDSGTATFTCDSTTGFQDYSPIVFYGSMTAGISLYYTTYYILPGFGSTTFQLAAMVGDTTPVALTGGVHAWSALAVVQTNTLAFTSTPLMATVTSISSSSLVCSRDIQTYTPGLPLNFQAGQPVIFTTGVPESCGLLKNTVYYIHEITGTNQFTVATSRTSTSPVTLVNTATCSMTCTSQTEPLYVTINGQARPDSSYAIVGNQLMILSPSNVGDIIRVSTPGLVQVAEMVTNTTPQLNTHFGTCVAVNTTGCEVLVGAPFELSNPANSNVDLEGAVFRFTNGGCRYGTILGTQPCDLLDTTKILLNDTLVILPAGTADMVALAINHQVPNVRASSISGVLAIQLVNSSLAKPDNKLTLSVFSMSDAAALGLSIYSPTQTIRDLHAGERSQFGSNIKFNEFDSFVVGAPVAIRHANTTFDMTIFDNDTTVFVDTFKDAGAVYMYDYVPTSTESVTNPGKYLYAQSVNSASLEYGAQPMYGQSLDFASGHVVVGSPNFQIPGKTGQVVTYYNASGLQDWSAARKSAPVIDIAGIKNTMIFDVKTSATQTNLDYFDPLQGKLLGAVRENLDYISGQDPAGYNSPKAINPGVMTWTSEKVGQTWFDTSNVRFINYHQNDIIYNGKHWGNIFPGSDVAIYSWVASALPPKDYTGPGKPYNTDMYSTGIKLMSSGNLLTTYYYWVRNTNMINGSSRKTLSDSILEQYISSPQSSGISYFSALDRNIFALYNCQYTQNSALHLGFSTGTSTDDTQSSLFNLIRNGYNDDFLPGLPTPGSGKEPESLYNKLLDSMCGVSIGGMITGSVPDDIEQMVPNPYLPKAAQYGINTRPSQSLFVDNLGALKNYLEYANSVLIQYPISESKRSVFLYKQGKINPSTGVPFFETTNYWNSVNWWAEGYTNNTRVAVQVDKYADLSALVVAEGTVAKVRFNGDGNWEVYVLASTGWQRVGLQNGTIQFNSSLWDYASGKLGFGESFFDTDVFSIFPSEETRNIVRALNEEIYTNELLMHRNKSLMLIFDYIQSENVAMQNYLPWLNKTSLVDVSHTVRPLGTSSVYQNDNQTFLEGFINEVKPYHVVIKEFLFKYTSKDTYPGMLTDFDLPAKWDQSLHKFSTPALEYQRYQVTFLSGDVNTTSNTIVIEPYRLSSGDMIKYVPSDPMQQLDVLINGYYYYVGVITESPTYTVALYSSASDAQNDRNRLSLSPQHSGTLVAYDKTVGNTLPTDPIWSSPDYSEWYANHGVSITGVPGYPIAVLTSYIGYNASSFTVSGASGFPINGVVLIDGEYIGYNSISRETNTLKDIQRGINGSDRTDHIPGTTIFMDLPAVLVLDGGRGYANPPMVTAWIDTTKYPEPTRKAVLRAEMNLDSILRIAVDDPGAGYAVLPEIIIEPSLTSPSFTADQVNINTNTFTLLDATVVDGDLVKYIAGSSIPTGLVANRYYYAGVLETDPLVSLALYYTREDAAADRNRVVITSTGSGRFTVCARASCVSDASPIRQNQMTMRFDRTTYSTRMTDWVSGAFYGSFFAGMLGNSAQVASSSIRLESTMPKISTVRAAASGGSFEINKVNSSSIIQWSSVLRNLVATTAADNSATVMPLGYESLSPEDLAYITPTLGFAIGMPIKFTGPVTFGGAHLEANVVYYVASVVSNTHFTLKDINDNPILVVDGAVGGTPCYCYTGTIKSDLTLQLDYSGILLATGTTKSTNTVMVPLTPTGQGGTSGLYTGAEVTFTKTRVEGILQPMIDRIVDNQIYYVTSVFDHQSFSFSTSRTPHTLKVTETRVFDTDTGQNNVIVCESTVGLAIGNPVVFSNMEIAYIPSLTFGGLSSSTIYHVSAIHLGNNKFSVSDTNYNTISLTDEIGTADMVNQRDVVQLTDSTGMANMNIGRPISPGQITGQQFTLYPTSRQYAISSVVVSNLLSYTIVQGVSSGILALKTTPDNVYRGMQFVLSTGYAGLSASPTNYYVADLGILSSTVVSCGTEYLVCDSTTIGSQGTFGFYPGMPVVFSHTTIGGIDLGTTYYVHAVLDSHSFSLRNQITDVVPITLSPHPIADGTMLVTGVPYITVSTTAAGAPIAITNDTTTTTMTQTVMTQPTFMVSYVLGGYRFATTNPGKGFAIGNTLTILGANLGGVSGVNDMTMLVSQVGIGVQCTSTNAATGLVHCNDTSGLVPGDQVTFDRMVVAGAPVTSFGGLTTGTTYTIGAVVSNTTFSLFDGIPVVLTDDTGTMYANNSHQGEITNAIVSGSPSVISEKYYFNVISEREVAVFYDVGMSLPVSAHDFNYKGIFKTQVMSTTSSGVVVSDASGFNINEPVWFTGMLFGGLELGTPYYVDSTSVGNTLVLSRTIGGTPINDLTPITYNINTPPCYAAAEGDYAFLPEPFFFNQSLVRLNNQVYQCKISNNDDTFIIGKWELLRPEDRRLNALDRIYAYYQPTVNMPGLDMTQLVSGITYPNNMYRGNAFAPEFQYPVDTILTDLNFQPMGINSSAITWDGTKYFAAGDTSTYSGVVSSIDTTSWSVYELMQPLGVTDMIYSGSIYVVTTSNIFNPVIISPDGINWVSNGDYTPFGSLPYEELPYDVSSINVANISLNAVAFQNLYVAVGTNVVISHDAYSWTEQYVPSSGSDLQDVFSLDIDISALPNWTGTGGWSGVTRLQGFISLGYHTTNTLALTSFNSNGLTWQVSPYIPTVTWTGAYSHALTTGTYNGDSIVLLGDNGIRMIGRFSDNSVPLSTFPYDPSNYDPTLNLGWSVISTGSTGVIHTDLSTHQITIGSTVGFESGSPISFEYSGVFGGIDPANTYFVKDIIDAENMTIAETVGGSIYLVSDWTGTANVTNRTSIKDVLYAQNIAVTKIISTSYAAQTVTIDQPENLEVGDPVVIISNAYGGLTNGQTYYVKTINVLQSYITLQENLGGVLTDVVLSDGNSGSTFPLMTKSIFVAVGKNGAIQTSFDGIIWKTRTSGTTENLTGVTYAVRASSSVPVPNNYDMTTFNVNHDTLELVVVADNDLVLKSNNGITWTLSHIFAQPDVTYTVKGDDFITGYGPEEMVPGIVEDNLTMTVKTRPGSNWQFYEHNSFGFNVKSLEFSSGSTFSFQNVVEIPAQVAVFLIDSSGLSTTLHSGYTVDWISKQITLSTPLVSPNKLRIDVYEIGGGNQLVKSNTTNHPVRVNVTTGFNEIYLECNYSAETYLGGGAVVLGSGQSSTTAIRTALGENTIECMDVSAISLNQRVNFYGTVFGGIVLGQSYYVKSISVSSKKITISDTINAGLAGSTVVLTSDTGSMELLISAIPVDTWSPPCVMHNGTRLVPGVMTTVTETQATNSLIMNTTGGIYVGDRIAFGSLVLGGITPFTAYYVTAILSETELTIETLAHGPVTLTTAYGGITAVTNDYAFAEVENDVTAKLVLPKSYNVNTDYLVYSILGESLPYQLGYSLPETDVFMADGGDTYQLSNYVGGDNWMSAVVELNGVRQSSSTYSISPFTNSITFTTAPGLGSEISLTSFHFTDVQYLHTQHDITGKSVTSIVSVDNKVAPPRAEVAVTALAGEVITATSTSGFTLDTTISFYGTGTDIGGITFGSIYYIQFIDPDGVSFKISLSPGGPVITLSTMSVNIFCKVYDRPAIRITTGVDHGLSDNDQVRIDGISGAYQLNNNVYYVRIIDARQFDLYYGTWHADFTIASFPVTGISSYISGGYVWLEPSFVLTCATVTGSISSGNLLTCDDTMMLVPNTPVMFTGTPFGNLLENTWYYILLVVDSTHFVISETLMGPEMVQTTATGTMTVTQWDQTNVDRLWVTVNGLRVPSSALRLNSHNKLSILTSVASSDVVTITNMIPSWTPNEMTYINQIDKAGNGSVYRANPESRTWLIEGLTPTSTTMHVQDVSKVTHTVIQTVLAPAPVGTVRSIGLTVDKRMICQITLRNTTTSATIDPSRLVVVMEHSAPILKIMGVGGISTGDTLQITTVEGNTLYLSGERVRFTTVDLTSNTIGGLQRGTDGTSVQPLHPKYAEVSGVLPQNRMTDADYLTAWQASDYVDADTDLDSGVPLQLGSTSGAIFLNQGIILE